MRERRVVNDGDSAKHMTLAFQNTRETTWRVLLLAVVVWVGTTTLLNFAYGASLRDNLDAVERATGGLVQAPLVFAPFVLVAMGSVIFGVGRLGWSDVGWHLPGIRPAVLVTLAFWLVMQPALVLWMVIFRGQLQLNQAWIDRGVGWFCGQLLAQLLGNALVEETVFRGFFLSQFYLKASARFRPVPALLLALLGSQAFFALTHIPNRLFVNVDLVDELLKDQLELFMIGLIYAVTFLVSRNIFVSVGLHSLYNQPARLVAAPFRPDVQIVWSALVLILLVVCRLARRSQQGNGLPYRNKRGART